MTMSDNMDSILTSSDYEETTKDLMTFCLQLIHHSQWKSVRALACGSYAEIPQCTLIVDYFGISCDKLDIDKMTYYTNYYAFHRSASLPETYHGDIIRSYTDGIHAGYVRLINEKDNTERQLLDWYTLKKDETRHGPAVLRNTERSAFRCKYSLSNADIDNNIKLHNIIENNRISLNDLVYAVHCPYWPVEANEWITRKRFRGFPSKSVIKTVIRYGCDFVQVSHNRLNNDGEWRFSFSKAELCIIRSWSISQRIVYNSLWVLNKKIARRNLCSYYFKTLMFWACEEKPTQFWLDDQLVHSVCELLIELMNCVKLKFCVNYFIPGNNMMDHLIDIDLVYEIKALWTISQSRQLIIEVTDGCRQFELFTARTIFHIECPAWTKRAHVIHQRINDKTDSFTDLFITNLSAELQNALYAELSHIYRALCCQLRSLRCVNVSDTQIYFLKSQSHLLFAVNLCNSQERDVIENCSRAVVISIVRDYVHCDTTGHMSSKQSNYYVEFNTKSRSTGDRLNVINEHNEQKCFLYSRSVDKHEIKPVNNYESEKISEGRNINIAVFHVIKMNTSTDPGVHHYREWPGVSPTVNISWFIAKAYLANLYYTTQRDFRLTIKTCDDIIDVHKQSEVNDKFAETTFPVVLSTKWTSIYDKEIQELLGLYSLCYYVFDPSRRSVYLGVCPVLFAFYLRIRATVDQFIRDRVFSKPTLDNYSMECLKHISECKCGGNANNGSLTVKTSLVTYFINRIPSLYIQVLRSSFWEVL